MKPFPAARTPLTALFGFAVAMAYLEAAVVVYLRRLHGITDLIRDVVVFDPILGLIEVGREAATLAMLLAAGWAAGRSASERLGLASFAFGIWDILYYAWLRIMIGWPGSLLDWDVLFLIPLPWWGPVLSPLLIAALAAIAGARAAVLAAEGRRLAWGWRHTAVAAAGGLLVLDAFMADALRLLPATYEALARMRPSPFNWPVYAAGLVAMAWAAWSGARPAVRLPN